MENHSTMLVNNIICETLHPDNDIAKIHNVINSIDYNACEKLIKNHNHHYIKNHYYIKKYNS